MFIISTATPPSVELVTANSILPFDASASIANISPPGIISPASPEFPANSSATKLSVNPNTTEETPILSVGLNIGKRNAIPSILVRGKEDGEKPIDFANWLLPYNAVITALKFTSKTLPDGQIELSSPFLLTKINPDQLKTDPRLGLVFSVKDLETLFGIKAEFDLVEYAINLNVPNVNGPNQSVQVNEAPIQLEGLPLIQSQNLNFSGIQQRINASGSDRSAIRYQGDLAAVGTVLDGSWYLRLNQPDVQKFNSWNLSEAQFLQQTNQSDYIIGSQPPFWRNQVGGEYWGFTTIQRQGFQPPIAFGGGGFSPNERLQTSQIRRTISGRAEPGTLIRLRQTFSDHAIAEVLVDSSGIYRFENIPFGNQIAGSYRVFLYPQGRLTAQPEIRDANYYSTPGLIPVGTNALIISGGLNRNYSNEQNFLGEFSDFRGGVAQRFGLTEEFTVGVGGIYDRSVKGLLDLFYQPKNVPLQVSLSSLASNSWTVDTNILYRPSARINAAFSSDILGSRLNLNWNVSSRLNLLAAYSSNDALALGAQVALSGRNNYTSVRTTIDTNNHFRWSLFQRLGQLQLQQDGNETGSRSELVYNFLRNNFLDSGSSVVVNYDTSNLNDNNFLNLGWRYRSPQRSLDGSYLWEAELGYGIGSQGSGITATLGTTVLPGLLLRGRYQGVSLISEQSSFNLELVSTLNLQQGINPDDRRFDYLRRQGGLLIQPFFDDKGNQGENNQLFDRENAESLLTVNNKTIKSLISEVRGDRILLRIPPGTYRVDIDPAGVPLGWQAAVTSYAVKVVAGSYTPVRIPLIPAYIVSGTVTDAGGNVIAGATVEATPTKSGNPVFSVTNDAGVYYLENLQQGIYTLQINGKKAQPNTLKIDANSPSLQELNLKRQERMENRQ